MFHTHKLKITFFIFLFGFSWVTPSLAQQDYEAEDLSYTSSGPSISVISESSSSNGQWVYLDASSSNEYIEFTVPGLSAGEYEVKVVVKEYTTRGKYQLSIDGTNIGSPVDQYAPNSIFTVTNFGATTFNTSGDKVFRLSVTGKNTNSSNYELSIDTIVLKTVSAPEAEDINYSSSGPSISVISDVNTSDGEWVYLDASSTNEYIEFTVPNVTAGTYHIRTMEKHFNTRGKYQFSIDGTDQGNEVDQYSASTRYEVSDLGKKNFSTSGDKTFRFTVTGKNSSSSNYRLSIDRLVLSSEASTYYVDAASGNDNDSGASPSQAWKTLTQVSNSSFDPGDEVLFKSGETFTGRLEINSSGTSSSPIIFDIYNGSQRATLDGEGAVDEVIFAKNQEYFELRNLDITNSNASNDQFDGDSFYLTGILIVNQDQGTLDHIHIKDCKIRDINSELVGSNSRYYGGVLYDVLGESVPSNYNDILVEGNTFDNLDRTGFNFRSTWGRRVANSEFGDDLSDGTKDNWYPNTNVVIRNNTFTNAGGNGLIVRVSKNALVEDNLFDHNGEDISGNAAFCFNTDSTIFQYNEFKNQVFNSGDTDAAGVDSDYRTKYTIIQYNYIHDNGQGGVTTTGGPTDTDVPEDFNIGTVIRYNILENNDRRGIYFSGNAYDASVYNNVVYNTTEGSYKVVEFNDWQVWPYDVTLVNNIFYAESNQSSYVFGQSDSIEFSNNSYFGSYADNLPVSATAQTISGVTKDSNYLLKDPRLSNPGTGEDGYKLRSGSPAISTGSSDPSQPQEDYYGNTVGSSINIGPFQGTPVSEDSYQTTSIDVIEDAYTRQGTYSDDNYGSASEVRVKKASADYTRIGLLKFDQSSFSGDIKKATLNIYANGNTSQQYQNFFYGIGNNWSESTVTENNRPGIGYNPQIASFTVDGQSSQWYSIDVTSFAQLQKKLGWSNVSFAITDANSSENLTRIISKDGSSVNKAYLEIEYYTQGSSKIVDKKSPEPTTDIGELPKKVFLNQNYPNPFNPTTSISYGVAETAQVRLTVYNVLGAKVATLVNEQKSPGKYRVNFNASNLSSGLYIYRLRTGSQTVIKKMMLIK